VTQHRVVILKEVNGERHLPIWIGSYEAEAIAMELQGVSASRPLPYDLIRTIIDDMGGTVDRIAVTDLSDDVFYARIVLQQNGREVEIDSRPSDALALAVRSGAPIFAAEDVIAESAIEFEHEVEDTEEVVDKFKEFLDQVSPEDFRGGEQ
jgi:bifunctional DNase/RNase